MADFLGAMYGQVRKRYRDMSDGTHAEVVALGASQPAVTATNVTVTIANAESVSGAANLEGRGVVRLDMPAAWTEAVITVQLSNDGTTWRNAYTQFGTEYTITAAADQSILLDPSDLASATHIRLRSGTADTPVAQGGARDLILVTRPI